MADDPTPPSRTDVRAGGLLDLSTGPGAPPPPEPPPRPPVTPDPAVKAGKTLDLSVKPPGTTSRKKPIQDFGGGLVMREKVDLSTKSAPAPESSAPTGPSEGPPRRETPRGGDSRDHRRDKSKGKGRGGDDGRGRSKGTAPASASSSLADLLDPEMLAKLRGG